MREALEDLSGAFERATSNKLTRSYATGSVIKERILKGEIADIAILPVRGMEDLQRQAKTSQTETIAVARSLIAVSVRAGAPRPDISSVESLKQSLLAASSIVYFDPTLGATNGVHFASVLERLGISEQMRPKTKLVRFPDAGPAEIVANGGAELAISQPVDILRAPGAQLVGPLPSELQNTRDFVYQAALLLDAREPTVAKSVLKVYRRP